MKIIIILCYSNGSENSITGNLMTVVNYIAMTSMVCRWCVHVSGQAIIFNNQSYIQTEEPHTCALNFFSSFFFTLSTSMDFLFWAWDGLVLTTSQTPTHPLVSSTAVKRRQEMGRTWERKLMMRIRWVTDADPVQTTAVDRTGLAWRKQTLYCYLK